MSRRASWRPDCGRGRAIRERKAFPNQPYPRPSRPNDFARRQRHVRQRPQAGRLGTVLDMMVAAHLPKVEFVVSPPSPSAERVHRRRQRATLKEDFSLSRDAAATGLILGPGWPTSGWRSTGRSLPKPLCSWRLIGFGFVWVKPYGDHAISAAAPVTSASCWSALCRVRHEGSVKPFREQLRPLQPGRNDQSPSFVA